MLIGEYIHTLDSKNRLSLPARFRKEIGSTVIVTRGFENCLFVFSATTWQKVAEKLENLPLGSLQSRGLARFILANASEVETDAAGRILIPEYLKEFAKLQGGVVVTGVSNRLEIWQEKVWESYRREIEKGAVDMAQALGEVGRF
jgi:MraZ protein